jgi:hypothetical protein
MTSVELIQKIFTSSDISGAIIVGLREVPLPAAGENWRPIATGTVFFAQTASDV